MSWVGIAANQCVSRNNLQDAVNNGVFTLKNAIPAGTKQVTKAEAAYYVNLNTSHSPFASKSNNQLVVKSNLQACTPLPYSWTLVYNYDDGDPLSNAAGYSSSTAACAATGPSITLYSYQNLIVTTAQYPLPATTFYSDPCGNNVFTELGSTYYKYYKLGSNVVTFAGGGQVATSTSCAPPASYTLEVTNFALDNADIYVNGSFYGSVGGSGLPNSFTITSLGDVSIIANHPGYMSVDYSFNGSYFTAYTGYYSVNTGPISTATGNTYSFVINA